MTDPDLRLRAGKNAGPKTLGGGIVVDALNAIAPTALAEGEFLNIELAQVAYNATGTIRNLSEAETVDYEIFLIPVDGSPEILLDSGTVAVASGATQPTEDSISLEGAFFVGDRIAFRATGTDINAWVELQFFTPTVVQNRIIEKVEIESSSDLETLVTALPGTSCIVSSMALYNPDSGAHTVVLYTSDDGTDFIRGQVAVPAGESVALSTSIILADGQQLKACLSGAVAVDAPYARGIVTMFDTSPAIAE